MIFISYIPTAVSSININDHLDQQQIEWSGHVFGIEDPCQLAQSFKPTVNTLTRIYLFGCRNESPLNNLIVSIRSVLDGPDLVSVIVDNSDIDLFYPDWFEVNFPNISVIPESTYFIVWTTTSGDIGKPFFYWCYGASNPDNNLYTRGYMWLNCGDDLRFDVNLADFCFKTFGYSIPSVNITVPVGGSSVYGLVSIQGNSMDNDGVVEKVEIKIDGGIWMSASGTTNWNYDWYTTNVVNGYHVIYARSYDGESYSDEVSTGVYVANTVLFIESANGGLNSVSADIQNIGDVDADYVRISILIKGGFFNRINVEDDEIISVIGSGEIYSFYTNEEIFGFGKIVITIFVYANNSDMFSKEFNGFILGPIIIIL